MMWISLAHAQAAGADDTGSTLMSMLPLFVMMGVLYFVMMRPQMKRQKEHKAMLEALAVGDEVVTSGGVIAKVTKIGEAYLNLEPSEGVQLVVQRTTVVQILPKGTLKSLL